MQKHTSSMYFKWTARLKYLHAEEHDLNKTSWQNIISNPNTLTYTHTVSFDYYIHSTLTSIIFTLIWFLMLSVFRFTVLMRSVSLSKATAFTEPWQKKKIMLALCECLLNVRQLKDILAWNIFYWVVIAGGKHCCLIHKHGLWWFLFSDSKTQAEYGTWY